MGKVSGIRAQGSDFELIVWDGRRGWRVKGEAFKV